MTIADAVLVVMFVGLTAYVIFGGADFGGGFWDLVAPRGNAGSAHRRLIEDTIGPVWEANHVWLIFALVVVWTGFPAAFAAVASTLYIPLTMAAFGIILRGSAFAFRKPLHDSRWEPVASRVFGLSSVLTPFFLGTVAGAVASGRVPPGNAAGDVLGAWLNPSSVLAGLLAVGLCAFLAAVLLTADARRAGDRDLAEAFRHRGIVMAVAVGGLALAGIAVVALDAPAIGQALVGRAAPLVVVSAAGGMATLGLLVRRRYVTARVSAGIAVTAVLWGWAVAQYPYLLGGELTVAEAAANETTLTVMLVGLLVGAALVVPSLIALYALFQRAPEGHSAEIVDVAERSGPS